MAAALLVSCQSEVNVNIQTNAAGSNGAAPKFELENMKIYKKYVGALPDKEARIKKDIETLLQ